VHPGYRRAIHKVLAYAPELIANKQQGKYCENNIPSHSELLYVIYLKPGYHMKASRHFKNKKREYLKYKINEIESNSENKNTRDLCRGTAEFKKVYQPRTNVVKDERSDLLADPHKTVNRWKNYLSAIECTWGRWCYAD
jgi:hypothetical protein